MITNILRSSVRRFPFRLMAASLSLGLLAACGQQETRLTASGQSARSTAPAAAAEPADTAPVPAPPDEGLQERIASLGFQVPQDAVEAPAFQLETLDGKTVSLADYRGKLVFLNFWATWCPPCRDEMPSMEALYRELAGEDFEMLAVDLQEDAQQVGAFVREYGLSFPILLDRTGRVGSLYGARNIPTTYLIDRQGRVLARTIGGREWDSPEIIGLFRDLLAR